MRNRIVLIFALLLSPVVAFATVTGTATNASFTCTGSTGPFPFTFPIDTAAAMTVVQNGAVLAPGNYTITPVNNSYDNGGSVTLNTACPTGQTIVLQRITPITQLTQFTPYMPALYANIEDGLDQLTEIDQEQESVLSGATCPVGQVLQGVLVPTCVPLVVAGSGCPTTGCAFTGPISGTSASFSGAVAGTSITSPNINTTLHSRGYGCKGDGITDDTACMVNFGNAVVAAAASGPVTMVFDPGRYMVNPLTGMQSYTTSANPAALFYFPTQSNITVIGQGATIALLPYTSSTHPTQPYNQQVGIASGEVFNFWVFSLGGSHLHFLGGLTFDGNSQSNGGFCVGSYGCVADNAIGDNVSGSGEDFQVTNETFVNLNGWPAFTYGVSHVLMSNNRADHSRGFVCANGSNDCTMTGNVSVNDNDAAYACNGGTGATSQLVTGCVISNNTADTNVNGSGIDITAANNVVVSDNYITGSDNWCILVDRSGGPYDGGPTTGVLPSTNVNLTGNTCVNNMYGNWPYNAEIMIGDQWAYPNNNSTNAAWTPGTTASNVTVTGNHIYAQNAYGLGVAVGYGAAHVKVSDNHIGGCGNGTSLICTAVAASPGPPLRIWLSNGVTTSISDVSLTNNRQLDYQTGTYVGEILNAANIDRLESFGNNMATVLGGGASVTAWVPQLATSGLQVGDLQNQTGLNVYGNATGAAPLMSFDQTTGGYAVPNYGFAPNTGASASIRNFVGHDKSFYNMASFGWYGYGTLGAATNQACLGFYGYEQKFCVDGTGNWINPHGVIVPSTALGYQGPAAGYVTTSISGSIALISGTATVSTTAACTVGTNCNYSLTNCGKNSSTGIGTLSVGTITAGTSFVINSLSPVAAVLTTDASTVCWQIN